MKIKYATRSPISVTLCQFRRVDTFQTPAIPLSAQRGAVLPTKPLPGIGNKGSSRLFGKVLLVSSASGRTNLVILLEDIMQD